MPVLYDIVKRRFVRVPPVPLVGQAGSSPETLNFRHMIGGLTAGHRTDLEKLVFSCQSPCGRPDGHWQCEQSSVLRAIGGCLGMHRR